MDVWTTLVLHNTSLINIGGKEKTAEPSLPVWRHSSSIAYEVLNRPGLRVSDIRGVILDARYKDDRVQGEGRMYLEVGERKHRLHISCSTRSPKVRGGIGCSVLSVVLQVGENIVFHVRSNKYVHHLNYVITNNGKVLESSTIKLAPHNIRTFHVMVREEMMPLATIMVWHLDSVDNVTIQSLSFPVNTVEREHSLVSKIINTIVVLTN